LAQNNDLTEDKTKIHFGVKKMYPRLGKEKVIVMERLDYYE
jgi:hypothetical protein